MANIFNLLKPTGTTPRNGFDLSRRDLFTAKPGYLIPCLSLEYNPNERHVIKPYNGIQTMPLQTNSFGIVKQSVDYYAVPYGALWSNFKQLIATRDDKRSSALKGTAYAPCFNLGKLLYRCLQFEREFAEEMDANNLTGRFSNEFGDSIARDIIRLLDMLGYGNYNWIFPVFDSSVEARWSNYKTDLDIRIQNADYDNSSSFLRDHYAQNLNMFRLLAYQYLWYRFYRNSVWDSRDYTRAFNVDFLQCTTFANSEWFNSTGDFALAVADSQILLYDSPFRMRFRGWKKDMFTGLYPSPQYGDLSTVSLQIPNFQLYNVSVERASSDDVWVGEGRNTAVSTYNAGGTQAGKAHASSNGSFDIWRMGSASNPSSVSFDVYALRKAEMLQKWREMLLRAGNKTSDIFKGLFGVDTPVDYEHEPLFLGSDGSDINIDPIVSTANTAKDVDTSSNLGDIGGRATSGISGKTFRFDSHSNFGVIIGLMSIIPDSEYNALMIDKQNTFSTADDFFNPMFQNLGFASVSNFMFSNAPAYGEPNQPNYVFGYAPRFLEFKTAIDKVHGEFMSFGQSVQGDITDTSGLGDSAGSLYPWALPRNNGKSVPSQRNLSFFYVSPHSLDSMFMMSADFLQDTDPFMISFYHDIKSVRPMSVSSLPQW